MIEIDEWSLEILNENDYTFNSVDNIHNYKIYSYGVGCNNYNATAKIGVRCTVTGLSVLLIATGGASSLHETSYVIDETNIIICVGDCVFCVDAIKLEINWVIKVDTSTCFQIYQTDKNYVVHGELEISCLNSKGHLIWKFSGKDIFVTIDGKDDFFIKDDRVYVKDWENNQYILDLNGNLL